MTAAISGAKIRIIAPVTYGANAIPCRMRSYCASSTCLPNASIWLTCWSSAACLPSSVVVGRMAKNATRTTVVASMPNHFGCATIERNVS